MPVNTGASPSRSSSLAINPPVTSRRIGIQLLMGVPAAWSFAVYRFRFGKAVFTMYVALMLLPFQVMGESGYIPKAPEVPKSFPARSGKPAFSHGRRQESSDLSEPLPFPFLSPSYLLRLSLTSYRFILPLLSCLSQFSLSEVGLLKKSVPMCKCDKESGLLP